MTYPYFTYQFVVCSFRSNVESRENNGRGKHGRVLNDRQKAYFDLGRLPISSLAEPTALSSISTLRGTNSLATIS